MGKASRRPRGARADRTTRPAPAPFVARPFEGLPSETEWVALREILPAATGEVRLTADGSTSAATVCTVLPLAWPALHRNGGEVFVATQSGATSGDPSRDIAAALLLAADADEGTPITTVPNPGADSPRLQDVLDLSMPFAVTIHDGFDFWVGDNALDQEGQQSLERANESVIPTTRMSTAPSAYWCRIGERTHVRLVLPEDEDVATDALARLHAAAESGLGEGTRLLGAFRACGLLVPVWELDSTRAADDYEEPLGEFTTRYAAAAASGASLTAGERRARSGLLSRQVTLR